MWRTKKVLKIGVPLFIVYIIGVNLLSFSILSFDFSSKNIINNSLTDSGEVVVGFSDSVAISVERKRFYGRIKETVTDKGSNSYLYILKFIRIPLEVENVNFNYLNIPVLIFSTIVIGTTIFYDILDPYDNYNGGYY